MVSLSNLESRRAVVAGGGHCVPRAGVRALCYRFNIASEDSRQHGAHRAGRRQPERRNRKEMLLLAPTPLVAGLAALPRPVPTFHAARMPAAVRAQEGRSPVERAGALGSPVALREARARQRARATRRSERDPRWEALWGALWSDGLLGRLTASQKRALLPWLPSGLPAGVRETLYPL